MTIEFFHSPMSAPSRSALLVAKHLKLPIKIRLINFSQGEQLKPEFLEVKFNN